MSISQNPVPHDLGRAIERLRSKWGWFVAFGLGVILCGFVSLGVVGIATLTSVYLIAVLMILIGGFEISIGISAHRWSSRIIVILLGLLYIVAASFLLANPIVGAVGLTLMVGAAMLATGIVRLYFATQLPEGPRWHVALAGVLTVLVGSPDPRRLAEQLGLCSGRISGPRHDHVWRELAELRAVSAPARRTDRLEATPMPR